MKLERERKVNMNKVVMMVGELTVCCATCVLMESAKRCGA